MVENSPAQRFNVGISAQGAVSPEGTAENPHPVSRPFGTGGPCLLIPTLKRVETLDWAILGHPCRMKMLPGNWSKISNKVLEFGSALDVGAWILLLDLIGTSALRVSRTDELRPCI